MGSFKSGDIIKFSILDKQFAADGFAMGGIWECDKDELLIFQTVDIESFPSWRDFKGKSTKIKDGGFGMIIRKIGRPWRLHHLGGAPDHYDVYEILTSKFTKRHIFKYNIEKVF